MTMYDVAVIGGGPAGNKAASLLSREYDVVVIEEHEVPGRPMQCTGLVSDEVIRLSGVKPTVLNELYGANVFFPNGKSIEIRAKERKAVLIDRAELDEMIAHKASDEGAEHRYLTKYASHSVSDGTVRTETDNGTIESLLIAGADGHNSKVARTIPGNDATEYVKGIQVDIKHRSGDEDMLNIRIGSAAPGFFSWEIPFGGLTRVGLCVSENAGPPSGYLNTLLRTIGLSGCEVISKHSGRIPLGHRRRTYAPHLMLIGDAACHVKPISGVGLQPAFRASYALAETAKEALNEHDFSENFLSVYEKRWKKDVGTELRRGYRLRKMYTSMSDAELNCVYEAAKDERITGMLSEGSIDHPSDLLFGMMMHPVTMLRLAPLMMKAMIRSA